MRTVRRQAAMALAGVGIGYLAVFPFRASWLGGMAAGSLTAALIGGIADWFAVNAIFRKPLGVRYRTEILLRNRRHITESIVDMVANRLLSRENLQAKIEEINFPAAVINYIEAAGGPKGLIYPVDRLIADVINRIDLQTITELLTQIVQDNHRALDIESRLGEAVARTMADGSNQRLMNTILDELIRLVRSEAAETVINDMLAAAMAGYEGDSLLKRLTNYLFLPGVATLTAEVRHRLLDYLTALKDPLHPARQRLQCLLADYVGGRQIDWEKVLPVINLKESFKQISSGTDWVLEWVETYWQQLKADTNKMRDFDTRVKALANRWLTEHHGLIADLVRQSLDGFTDAELVQYVEARVGDDLQWIRINGTVIGGAVGLLVYLLMRLIIPIGPLFAR